MLYKVLIGLLVVGAAFLVFAVFSKPANAAASMSRKQATTAIEKWSNTGVGHF